MAGISVELKYVLLTENTQAYYFNITLSTV